MREIEEVLFQFFYLYLIVLIRTFPDIFT